MVLLSNSIHIQDTVVLIMPTSHHVALKGLKKTGLNQEQKNYREKPIQTTDNLKGLQGRSKRKNNLANEEKK